LQLASLGYGPFFSDSFDSLARPDLVPARVTSHLGAHLLVGGAAAHRAEPSGRLRHELAPAELPTVGDWVALAPGARPDDVAIIHHVLPRRTALIRRAAGTRGEPQVVAANVDTFLVVTSANRDANPRRLERYLAAIAESGAAAVVVINKADLCTAEELAAITAKLAGSVRELPVLAVSAATGAGLSALSGAIRPGHTIALVGMSGVGKSSLVNRLLGDERQGVAEIDDNDRGRHATTRRELMVLPGGGVLIDTPGMRELGLAEDRGGVAASFDDVLDAARACRFRDCRHAGEPGCAVAAALDDGALDPDRVASFHKLEREAAAAERRANPAAAARAKQRWKTVHQAMRARGKLDPKLQR
jgi:ribosome biogenesis GTPase / thiamine phosphate phosphatase